MMIVDFPSGILDLPCGKMHWLSQLSTESTNASRKVPSRNWSLRSSYHARWTIISDWERPSIVPLLFLMMRLESTFELGFENEVQDIPGWRMRHTKINCPSIGFVQSQLYDKIFWTASLLLNLSRTTISENLREFLLWSYPKLSILWI